MAQSDFGKEGFITERNVTGFLIAGALANIASLHLESITLRSDVWLWVSVAVPSVFAYFYFYRDIKPAEKYDVKIGNYLKRVFLHLFLIVGCVGMAGGYINTIVLGVNYQWHHPEIQQTRFEIVEIRHVSSRGRFERLLVTISNGVNTEEVDRPLDEEEQLLQDKFIDIDCAEGLLGWTFLP
jgi:hypothetical protein